MSVTRLSNAKGLCHVGCGRGMWPLLLNLNTELGAGRKHEARTGVTTGDRMIDE